VQNHPLIKDAQNVSLYKEPYEQSVDAVR
jgi:hypothetical protein